MKMAEASRICSGAGNLFTLFPNPSPTVSAKFWAGRSCMIETESIDEPRGFSEVTKGDGWAGASESGDSHGREAQEGGSQTRGWRSRGQEGERLMTQKGILGVSWIELNYGTQLGLVEGKQNYGEIDRQTAEMTTQRRRGRLRNQEQGAKSTSTS